MIIKKLKKGFYISSTLNSKILYIVKWEDVVIFDDDNKIRKIILFDNSSLKYFSSFTNKEQYNKHILLKWKNSKCEFNSFILSIWNKVKVNILWEIVSNNSFIDMKMLSFIWKNWFIDLDGTVKIWNNLLNVKWYLEEKNIFLSSTWKIKWIPKLLVWSNDVKAWHSCSIEKIKNEELFYLRSRWINKNNAIRMMLRNYLSSNFSSLWRINNKFCSIVVKNIFSKI